MLRLAVILVLGVLAQQTFADEPEKIVGGETARQGEFPHQCSLRFRGSHICGASIIGPKTILTAAHCVTGIAYPPYSNFKVVTSTNDNYGGIEHIVDKVITHPNYKDGVQYSWENDVAVITLRYPIQFNNLQKPIPLPNTPPQPGTVLTLSGWGKTATNGPIPRLLQKMFTTMISKEQCQRAFGPRQPLTDSHLCAFTQKGIGACQGDSGGPLIYNGYQYGITSFVAPCALGVPDVYTSVYHQLGFIRPYL